MATASLLAVILATGCQSLTTRPTAPPQVVIDVVGTVTAQAAPAIATQTAVSAAFTQVVQVQASQTAQAQAQQAATEQVTTANAVIATQTALAQVAGAQAATATSLARVAAEQAGTATALAQAVAVQAGTATAVGVPVSSATVMPATTRIPTTTASVSASGTPTAPAPVACVPVNTALTGIAGKAATAGLAPGCPTAAAFSVNGAVQEYWKNVSNPDPKTHWRSLMIWREDTQAIYVIDGQDTQTGQGKLLSHTDTFKEGEPEILPACASMQPPAGYLMPIRGFGKVWCANQLAGVIGWPNRQETAASLLIQPTLNGLLMKVSAPDQNLGALVALDFSAARAVTSSAAP